MSTTSYSYLCPWCVMNQWINSTKFFFKAQMVCVVAMRMCLSDLQEPLLSVGLSTLKSIPVLDWSLDFPDCSLPMTVWQGVKASTVLEGAKLLWQTPLAFWLPDSLVDLSLELQLSLKGFYPTFLSSGFLSLTHHQTCILVWYWLPLYFFSQAFS